MDAVQPLQRRVREFLEFTAAHPQPQLDPFTLPAARAAVVEAQSGIVTAPPVSMERLTLAGLPAYIYRPVGATSPPPAALYFHGGGWALCDHRTHDRLMRELAAGSGTAIVFVEYSLSPEKRYPAALLEAYHATEHVARHADELGLDGSRLAIAGDSAGANLATVVTMLVNRHDGPRLRFQLLFFPVTDAAMDTPSYREFAEGYFLTRAQMRFFWDCYASDPAARAQSTVSPLRARLDELHGLPEALVITADHDVLRDEGEAYASRLAAAGVPVTATRYPGTIHAFVVLNAFTDDPSPRRAIAQAADALHKALGPSGGDA